MGDKIQYTIVGHFAKDLAPEGYRLGGAVYYSGIQALKLGAEVCVISSAGSDLDLSQLPPELRCYVREAPQSTTFENVYDEKGNRTQHVRGQALPLLPQDAPSDLQPTLLQLGPLVGEVAANYADAYPAAKLCITPQGWMRHIDGLGLVSPKAWEEAESVLSRAWAVVFSEEDVGFDETKIEWLATQCEIGVCTRNFSGATLFYEGKRVHVPALPVTVVDPTGAGDVFAASFFIRLHETQNPEVAVEFAHAAAGLSITGIGVNSVGDREAIETLLRQG